MDERNGKQTLRIPPLASASAGPLADSRRRGLRDLRISVTDRCNFRCSYCMPSEVFDDDYRFLPHGDVLTFEEIVRLARIFRGHGIEKIRLTGGEPLLRKEMSCWWKCSPGNCPASCYPDHQWFGIESKSQSTEGGRSDAHQREPRFAG